MPESLHFVRYGAPIAYYRALSSPDASATSGPAFDVMEYRGDNLLPWTSRVSLENDRCLNLPYVAILSGPATTSKHVHLWRESFASNWKSALLRSLRLLSTVSWSFPRGLLIPSSASPRGMPWYREHELALRSKKPSLHMRPIIRVVLRRPGRNFCPATPFRFALAHSHLLRRETDAGQSYDALHEALDVVVAISPTLDQRLILASPDETMILASLDMNLAVVASLLGWHLILAPFGRSKVCLIARSTRRVLALATPLLCLITAQLTNSPH